MRLVLYLGGPRAVEGEYYWMGADKLHPDWRACLTAAAVGADIPVDTYTLADPTVSAYINGTTLGKFYGVNYTAILPLEVDE